MAWWARFARSFRPSRVSDELDEELQSHIEEAVAHGRDPDEARRALGLPVRHREASRDIRLLPWLDALRADIRFGWRQILKTRVTSAAAIVSLGLAMGACVAAFRIVDAMFLRPLPIAHPERLFELVRLGTDAHGLPTEDDVCEYPLFALMRDRVRNQADVIAISSAIPTDVFYEGSPDAEKANREFVSGTMFGVFGLRPALGRLFSADDDAVPAAAPYAVLSYDYWRRRFGGEVSAIGRTFRVGTTTYEIVGVAPAGFTGTEPGVPADIFVPAMMNPQVIRADSSWFRAFVHVHAGVRMDDLIGPLGSVFQSVQEERAKGFIGLSPEYTRAFLTRRLVANPASSGVSFLQRNYASALAALAVFVALVLLIACANISNLKSAQAAARAREMALRVSIGAGTGRLLQLMLVESLTIAVAAGGVGAAVAWWAAPFVVSRLNPRANTIALALPIDGRVAAFGLALTFSAALLFGLLPAVRAIRTTPARALKGGSSPASQRRTWHAPIAAQVAFCALVLLIGGLFVSTFDRLAAQPVGFSPERLIDLETVAQPSQPPAVWNDIVASLQAIPGVESAAASQFALLSGIGSNAFIWIDGAPTTDTRAYFLGVSAGWRGVMNIPLIDGRDLRDSDLSAGAAIVNEAFAKEYFAGRNPIGQWFERQLGTATRPRYEIVGVVRNARYRNIRETITPTAYVPLSVVGASASRPLAEATLVVRTSVADPSVLVPALRRAVLSRSGFRVSAVETQQDVDDAQIVRERLLAMLAWFFCIVALALTAIGLYGVLHYTVQQRQREIGICRAIGAPGRDIIWRVTGRVGLVLAAGTVAGLGAGLVLARFLTTLFFGVRPTDALQLALPTLAVLAASLLASVAPIVRALKVNPIVALRGE